MIKTSALFLFVLLIHFSSVAQPVTRHGQLKVSGSQLVDQKGAPLVLRGMSFGWHNFWPKFYNAGAVEWLYKDWNSSIVRAAMGIEPDKGYLKDPEGSLKRITAVVDAAIKNGIYVIIDWHSHNINQPQATEFFKMMAKKYGHHPNVIYEIFNEPDQESWPEIKAYSIEIIKAIREIDPDNIILVGCPRWDQEIQLVAADPIKGFNNLMYTVHFYAATHKQWLRDRTDAALKSGIPIFVSECAGMEATGDGPLNLEEWKAWIDFMDSRKISWITWSVSSKIETCSVLLPHAPAEGNWKKEDLNESGIRIREILRSYPSVQN